MKIKIITIIMDLKNSKKEHFKLLELKDSNSLTKQDQSKLRSYSAILDNQVNWEIREQYFEILKDFVEEKISFSIFQFLFNERYDESQEICDFLESNCCLLSPDEKSLKFADFLSQIFWSWKELTEPYDDRSFDLEKAEIEFKNSMQKIYLELQKLFENE